jgi:hypothetical protein
MAQPRPMPQFDPPDPIPFPRNPRLVPVPEPAEPAINPAPVEADVAPRRVALPPQPHDSVKVWTSIIISILVCLPALLVSLDEPDVLPGPEAQSLAVSRETWHRFHAGDRLAFMTPSLNGQPQIEHPPLAVWMHMLAWQDLGSSTPVAKLIFRARLLSVLMGMLALIATYWAGTSVGDVRTARVAALSLGTTLLFISQVRVATPEVQLLGWVCLAIAAGLWAMRPLKDIAWVGRRVLGWLLAGAALGAAVLTAGPAGCLFVLPPLIAAIVLTPRRRIDNTLGLIFAVLLGTMLAAPWYLFELGRMADALKVWQGDLIVHREVFLVSWSHLLLAPMLWPWPVWLIGALLQPFIRADSQRRRQLLIAWFWFVLGFIVLSIPAAENPRLLLPVLPAAALMVGQLWSYHAQLATERQEDPGVNFLRVPHWVMIGFASILGPLFLVIQPELVEAGYMKRVEMPGVTWLAALGLGLALLLTAILGTRWHFKWRPRGAAYATVAWMVIAGTAAFYTLAKSPSARYDHLTDAVALAAAVAANSFTLPNPDEHRAQVLLLARNPREEKLEPALLFYAGLSARTLSPAELPDAAAKNPGHLVIARDEPPLNQSMKELGFTPVLSFHDGEMARVLYRHDPAKIVALR